jgi:hypothetical protein
LDGVAAGEPGVAEVLEFLTMPFESMQGVELPGVVVVPGVLPDAVPGVLGALGLVVLACPGVVVDGVLPIVELQGGSPLGEVVPGVVWPGVVEAPGLVDVPGVVDAPGVVEVPGC